MKKWTAKVEIPLALSSFHRRFASKLASNEAFIPSFASKRVFVAPCLG
jgi:hypothetical protein